MTLPQIGRYSKYIRPISILMDLIIISVLGFLLFENLRIDLVFYLLYQGLGWLVIAVFLKFYGIYRFTKPIEIISKIIRQGILFILIVIAFFPFFSQAIFNAKRIGTFVLCSMVLITISKFFCFIV